MFAPRPGSPPPDYMPALGLVQRTSVQYQDIDKGSPAGQPSARQLRGCQHSIAAHTHPFRQSDRGRLLSIC